MAQPRSARPVGRPVGATTKGATTRRHIIDSAANVFAKVGYDKARMSDIIDATGLTKGAVYFHFDSKESLALAVLEAKKTEWLARVRADLAAELPGRRRITALLPTMLKAHRDDTSMWAIAKLSRNLTELGPDSPVHKPVAELNQGWIDLVAEVIRDAQTLGDARSDIDPTSAATAMIGAFDGIKAIHDTLGTDSAEPFTSTASALETMMLTGLLTDPESKHG